MSQRTTAPPARPRLAKPPVPKAKRRSRPPAQVEERDAGQTLLAAQAADAHGKDRIPGVPRQVSRSAKTTVAVIFALAVVLAVAGGLKAMQAHQDQLADEARATQPAEAVPSQPAAAPSWPAITPTATAAPSVVPTAEPTVTIEAPFAATSSVPGAVGSFPPSAGSPPLPVTGAKPGMGQEQPIDSHDPAGGSLVAQANRAMARGAATKALELARQAVAANPDDADAWLTLGAACQSTGNVAGARDAYRNCVARAHTPNISECRLLLR